jgi:hypothetical protein
MSEPARVRVAPTIAMAVSPQATNSGSRKTFDLVMPGCRSACMLSPARLPKERSLQRRKGAANRFEAAEAPIGDEVCRIVRGGLVNAFRRPGTRWIEAQVKYPVSRRRITVRDDGESIDPQSMRAVREGHGGFSGIRERAEGIGARLKVRSRAGGGQKSSCPSQAESPFSTIHLNGHSGGWPDCTGGKQEQRLQKG